MELEAIKQELSEQFEMIDLMEIHQHLGFEVTQNRTLKTIKINRRSYIKEILARFKMLDCKPVSTPMHVNVKLTKGMCPQSTDEKEEMATVPYQAAVGSLMYAMVVTRPDIACAIGDVSQYLTNPGMTHWTAVKRILCYLKGIAVSNMDLQLKNTYL